MAYIIIIIIPIIVLGYYITDRFSNNVLEQNQDVYYNRAQQLSQNLMNRLYSYAEIIDTVAYDKRLISYITRKYDEDIDAYNDYMNNISPIISGVLYKENRLVIKVYCDNDIISFSNIFVDNFKNFNNIDGFEQIKTNKSKISWNGISHYNQKDYLCCNALIKDYINSSNKAVGAVILLIDENILYSLIEKENLDGNVVFIYDDKGNIITSTERNYIGESMKDVSKGFKKGSRQSNIKINGKDYLSIKSIMNDDKLYIRDWGIQFFIPTAQMMQNMKKIWISSLWLSLLCIALSLVVIAGLSHNITSRIRVLIQKMNQVKKGDLKIAIHMTGRDEIGQLNNIFDIMVKELDRLINEVYYTKLKMQDTEIQKQKIENTKKEAELVSLQNQINPHYLFNTLESIRMNLLLKGDRETSTIVKLFGDTFRASMRGKSDMISIKDELNFIRDYFIIQKYRYKDKIDYIMTVSPNLMEYEIPKFILQPLIENAIYHGLELKDGNGSVDITIQQEHHAIHLNVSDNGIGMSQVELDQLLTFLHNGEQSKQKSYALKNIYNRLKLLFGDELVFLIQSKINIGTQIDIYIPKGDDGNVWSDDR